MSENPGYNIVTLMKRLEAATSRLEDLTIYHSQALTNSARKTEQGTLTKGDKVTDSKPTKSDTPKSVSAPAPSVKKEGEGYNAEAITAFKEFVDSKVKKLTDISGEIDPVLAEQAAFLLAGFEHEYKILQLTAESTKPDYTSPAFTELFQPISASGESIVKLRESNRGSKVANNLAGVAEGMPVLVWVTIDSTPVDFIGEFKDGAQYYLNRVLKEFKNVDEKQVEWVALLAGIFSDLQAYVKKFFPKGLTWNEKGRPLEEVKKAPVSAAASFAPPPPPPPPPMPTTDIFKDDTPSASSAASGGIDAVFQELNKGESITSGLKKVEKKKETGEGSGKTPPPPPKKPSNLKSGPTAEKTKKKPARKELEGSKWILENFDDSHELVIEGEMTQGVFIDKCSNCTIQIKGKVNAVTINESSKVGVMIENLVSGVDIIKSSRFGIQITGVLPTLTIDQSHDGQIYLSKESLDAKIYTAQTSGLNVNIPKKDDGDYTEVPLPEQILHKLDVSGNTIESTVVSIEE